MNIIQHRLSLIRLIFEKLKYLNRKLQVMFILTYFLGIYNEDYRIIILYSYSLVYAVSHRPENSDLSGIGLIILII